MEQARPQTENILSTATIGAKEGRDVIIVDTPNSCERTDMKSVNDVQTMMKIRLPLVNMSVMLCVKNI